MLRGRDLDGKALLKHLTVGHEAVEMETWKNETAFLCEAHGWIAEIEDITLADWEIVVLDTRTRD